ncbi:hypothetical protein Glove_256g3 [Diversispora epigaea]|uniref:Uncharacterized protein n=1 Tax=Diversispora epigaea TaxID=1348612 RepID=A0A397I7B5_9GLOM|nr:hypothetical protein Glove_256g3 [Diversispora epigaea]
MSDRPQVSLESIPNYMSPSILLCPYNINKTNFDRAYYTENVNQFFNLDSTLEGVVNITNYYEIVNKSYGNYQSICLLFNETSLPKPKKDKGAFYIFSFFNESFGVDVFIAVQTVSSGSSRSYIFYTETCYIQLDNSHVHRSFQCSAINYPSYDTTENIGIGIIALKEVITYIEEPALQLADTFSNIGGYISICGIFVFLFADDGFITFLSNKKRDSASYDTDTEKGQDNVKG